jgi:RNA polymerase sigma-70 factor (ECF subfamily)
LALVTHPAADTEDIWPMRGRRSSSKRPSSVGEDVDFDALYRQSAPQVARWAARLGGPTVDAADVVQEVFVVAYRRRATLRSEVKPTTWLFGITLRIVQAHRRKHRLRQWLLRLRAPVDEVAFSGPTPIESLEQRRAEAKAYRILDEMAPKYRDTFIMFEIEGLSTHEIAELTGQNLATIKVWLHRARAKFMERLAQAPARGEKRT